MREEQHGGRLKVSVLVTGGIGFPGGTVVKNPHATAGGARDTGSIPGSGKSPGVGHGTPLQHSCLENRIVKGAWQSQT